MTSKQSPTRRPFGRPMLCKAIDVVPEDENYLASEKLDGWRGLAERTKDGVTLTSREGHVLSAVPYVEDALAAVCQPGTVLDGELVDLAEPRQRKRTGSLLAASRQHKPTAASPPLTYAIFDILCCGDTDLRDMPLHARLAELDRLLDSDVGRIHTAPFVEGRTEPALMVVEHRPSTAAYAQSVIDEGGEGVVVKHRDSRYRHGAKNAGWFKFKPQQTVDAECIGIVPSTVGANVPGAIAFRLDSGIEGTAGSGISDLEWREMTQHPDKYVGHMIELAHHGEEKSGALRNPVFRGVRDPRDKATPRRTSPTRQAPESPAVATASNARKRRNYKKMGDTKLATCIRELWAHEGDAYDRCLERGSGDPDGDLVVALDAAKGRGLRV
jgi:ATP-dependent DNA ligase